MSHAALHLIVPLIVAWLFFSPQWRRATLIMLATMLVDLDHLLANPIYDPQRCSIGFHPLHSWPALVAYGALFAVPLVVGKGKPGARVVLLIGLGLLIHMALDGVDCLNWYL